MVDMLDRDIDRCRGAAEVSITDDELKAQRSSIRGDLRCDERGVDRIIEIERDQISRDLTPSEGQWESLRISTS